MSNTLHNDVIITNTAAVDAFLSLSKVYLASIERLSALNLSTAREAVEDCTAASKTLTEAKAGDDLVGLLSGLGQPMWEKALAHSRNTYEIVAKSHEEMSKVIAGRLAQPQLASSGLAGWSVLSEMFTNGVQQIGAAAAENVAASVGARAKVVAVPSTDAKKTA